MIPCCGLFEAVLTIRYDKSPIPAAMDPLGFATPQLRTPKKPFKSGGLYCDIGLSRREHSFHINEAKSTHGGPCPYNTGGSRSHEVRQDNEDK